MRCILNSDQDSGFTDHCYRIRNLRSILADVSYDSQDMCMYIYIYKRTKFRELKSEYRCFVMSIVVANRNDDNLNFEIGDSIRKFLKIQWNNWIRNVSSNSIIILFYFIILFYYILLLYIILLLFSYFFIPFSRNFSFQ